MNDEQRLAPGFPSIVIQRPLSSAVAAACAVIVLVVVAFRLQGHMLIPGLDNMDTLTPAWISILILRGLYAMRKDTDLQAVSMAMLVALSFIFIYEAIYKISFYITYPMPSAELREFVIQTGIALTSVVGFAYGRLHFSKWSKIFAAAFVLLYAFWMLCGFPQVNTNANVYWMVIPLRFSWNAIYLVNRGTKILMFLTYLFFYSAPSRKAEQPEAPVASHV